MSQEEKEKILKARVAVYRAGVNAGLWRDVVAEEASEMMNYVFQKSGQVAYYNLMLEYMRREHEMLTGSVYHLFKLPVQIEKELTDYVKHVQMDKGAESKFVRNMVEDAEQYLAEMDTIATDYGSGVVCVGSFTQDNIDNLVRLCIAHYRNCCKTGTKSYPYIS